jgi:hypothetical protein
LNIRFTVLESKHSQLRFTRDSDRGSRILVSRHDNQKP